MTERKQFRAIKGVRDILPPDTALWNHVERTAHEVFASYNFGDVRVPIFEQTELFARSIGTETDVVSKEMFTFLVQEPQLDSIAALREAITKWPTIRLPKHLFESFGNLVDSFVAAYTDALEHGLVPSDDFNRLVLRNLKADADQLKNADLSIAQKSVMRVQANLEQIELGLKVSLRPEATASVCRAYIEHGMHTLPGNAKLYYIGPMFRRERPQKGRYRQFYQIGAEVLGQSDAPGIDAEVIEMLLAFFEKVGLKGATLYVNSIGHSADNCRRGYVEKLREALIKMKDQLGPDSQRRIDTNPLRVLDSKLPEEQPIIETLPRIADHLCDDCRAHFAKLQEELKLRGIAYEINWRLVRGLDYYMRTTFEITAPGLGSQNAVCGGGRYDGLVELLGGQPTKGIGFAIGEDRLILSLQEQGAAQIKKGIDVFVAWMGETAYPPSVKLARRLRDVGLSVELPAEAMKFKKSLGLADKLGARYALIIGEDEVASGQFTLKNLSVGEQQKFSEVDLIDYLKSLQPVG